MSAQSDSPDPDEDIPFDDPVLPPEATIGPVVTVEEFIARRNDDGSSALVTCAQGTVIARASLVEFVAKTGDGKTTASVDLVLHAAGGRDYCGLSFTRPLRLLYIQNEGPREAFREKLELRLETWERGVDGEPILIWDEPDTWGLVKLSDEVTRLRIREAIEHHRIDFVVSDTLTRFGVVGNGTPEDTRKFVDLMTETGLGRDVGFLLLHHPLTRPDPSLGELEQIAGAWAPHADTILMLKKLPGNRARLSFPKLRHARAERPASILAYDPDTQTFTWVDDDVHEDDQVTPVTYEQRILDYLEDNPWATTEQLNGKTVDGQRGVTGKAAQLREARKRLVDAGLIVSAPSQEVGHPGKGLRWNLAPQAKNNPVPLFGTGQDENGSHPSLASVTPSPRPHVRGEGVRDGDGDGADDETLTAGFA